MPTSGVLCSLCCAWIPQHVLAHAFSLVAPHDGLSESLSLLWRSATGGNARVARELLTGVVPVIISSAWDTFVLPLLFYMLAQSERRCMSLHALDKRVSSFFFYFATFNTFFGAALGGRASPCDCAKQDQCYCTAS